MEEKVWMTWSVRKSARVYPEAGFSLVLRAHWDLALKRDSWVLLISDLEQIHLLCKFFLHNRCHSSQLAKNNYDRLLTIKNVPGG